MISVFQFYSRLSCKLAVKKKNYGILSLRGERRNNLHHKSLGLGIWKIYANQRIRRLNRERDRETKRRTLELKLSLCFAWPIIKPWRLTFINYHYHISIRYLFRYITLICHLSKAPLVASGGNGEERQTNDQKRAVETRDSEICQDVCCAEMKGCWRSNNPCYVVTSKHCLLRTWLEASSNTGFTTEDECHTQFVLKAVERNSKRLYLRWMKHLISFVLNTTIEQSYKGM